MPSSAGENAKFRDRFLGVSDCSKAIELDSSYWNAYLCLGMTYTGQENYDLAMTYFNKAIEIDANIAEAYSYRGNAYVRQNDYDLAISDFSKAIEIDPKQADVFIWRGNAFADTKRFSQAVLDYEKALTIAENSSEISYILCVEGITYTKMGDFDLAISNLEKGVKEDVAGEYGWCKMALDNARQGIPTP